MGAHWVPGGSVRRHAPDAPAGGNLPPRRRAGRQHAPRPR